MFNINKGGGSGISIFFTCRLTLLGHFFMCQVIKYSVLQKIKNFITSVLNPIFLDEGIFHLKTNQVFHVVPQHICETCCILTVHYVNHIKFNNVDTAQEILDSL